MAPGNSLLSLDLESTGSLETCGSMTIGQRPSTVISPHLSPSVMSFQDFIKSKEEFDRKHKYDLIVKVENSLFPENSLKP